MLNFREVPGDGQLESTIFHFYSSGLQKSPAWDAGFCLIQTISENPEDGD